MTNMAAHYDLMALSAHKMRGPMGIGALYIARAAQPQIAPILFGGDRRKTDALDQFTCEWRGAHHDFVDPTVQEKLINLRASANELAEAIAINTHPVDTNLSWSTPHPGSNALNADERALEAGKLLNAAATAYVAAVDDFEQVAKVKIPIASPG